MVARFEEMLAAGQDNALLRYTLGNAYLGEGRPQEAARHLQRAVEQDPEYSAAWKLLGRALAAQGQEAEALEVYRQGIEVAERRGDKQAAREMQVFLKRLQRDDGG